jgi:hypothetical protein
MRVKQACSYQWYDPAIDNIVKLDFKAGPVTPKSENEEYALKQLLDAGLAELTTDKDEE